MITDEMVDKAVQVWLENASDYTRLHVSIRAALEAVAPMLLTDYSTTTKQVREDLREEIQEARTILAGTDIGSLPNDMPLLLMCKARMRDLAHAQELDPQ